MHLAQPQVSRSVVSRILLVDEPDELSDLRAWLLGKGYEVHTARDAGQARSLVVTRRPDFVLTEALLPRETGYELCNFLKQQNEALPVVMLTDIDLDVSRNLSMWCGADGYITKPFYFDDLERLITGVADAVWLKTHAQTSSTGQIEFACQCGKRLSVRQENAGKGVRCPKCQKLIKAPKYTANLTGTWKRSEVASPRQDQGQGNLFCGRCGKLVHLLAHNRHDHAVCGNCGQKHSAPKWLLDQRRFFFQPPMPDSVCEQRIRRRLQQYLMISCGECQARYPLDPDHPEFARECPACGNVSNQPSLRDSPLTKAALTSTGRFFAVLTGRNKFQKFLLPADREILVGSDDCCALRFVERHVADIHAALWWTDGGPCVRPIGDQNEVLLNDEPVVQSATIFPGDLLRIGSVKLCLLGNRDLEVCDNLITTQSNDHEESMSVRDTRIANQAATVLQIYWEHQREWIRQHPDWTVEDKVLTETVTNVPTGSLPPKVLWSAASSQRPLNTRVLDEAAPGNKANDPRDGVSLQRRPAVPSSSLPLQLPDPSLCGPVAPPEPAEEPVTNWRRLKAKKAVTADDAAKQIISGLHQRPIR